MLNETNINCFMSLCETLSFTETAKRLYITQQAVSKNIMQLETDFGFPLVDRSGRSITLTNEGRRCQEMFRELSEHYSAVLTKIRKDYDSAHHSLNIGYQNFLDFGADLVTANKRMGTLYPEYSLRTFRYAPGILLQMLYDDSLDMIVLYGRYAPENPDYQNKILFSVKLNIMVSIDNPEISEDSTYLDFRREPYIMDVFPGETDKAIEFRARREISLCGLDPSAIITVPNRESAYTTAELGGGIILGSDISNISKGLRLMRYRTKVQDNIVCVWKKGNAVEAVRKYAAILAEEYQNSGIKTASDAT